MKLVADESVDGEIVRALRREGHRVEYPAELDPGAGDTEVLHRAGVARRPESY